jgi:hypothetical protein
MTSKVCSLRAKTRQLKANRKFSSPLMIILSPGAPTGNVGYRQAAWPGALYDCGRRRPAGARVSAGIRNARAAGKQLGRPVRIVDREQILRLRAEGASVREIAAKVGVGYGTVRKRLALGELKTIV